MSLEKVIQKLKISECNTPEERENVNINISVCEMQIKIIDKFKRKKKVNKI
tara:strand:- start:742 stop:894 length:153 start_codon:yes stop_codon:yes gene_type:complete